MKKTAGIILTLSLFITLALPAQAQKFKAKDMMFTGHGWYGVDMEKTRPNLKTYGYMTYEASVGLQTNPDDGSAFSQLFG